MSSKFLRHADDEISDSSIQMPRRLLATTVHHCPIDVLARGFENYQADPTNAHDQYPWAARFVLGIPVPSCSGDWCGMQDRSRDSFLQCGQAQIWGVTSPILGAAIQMLGRPWQRTVKFFWMGNNVYTALRSFFWIVWPFRIFRGSQGSGQRLVLSSASAFCPRPLHIQTSALMTSLHCARRMIFLPLV